MLSLQLVNLGYLLSAILFIMGIKQLTHPRTAARGNRTSAVGMGLAIVCALVSDPSELFAGQEFTWRYDYILIGMAIGTAIGVFTAVKVKMTKMPEMVGIFNGFGGAASVLVAAAAMLVAISTGDTDNAQTNIATVVSGIIGSVTFFGSYVAFGKLAEFLAVKWKLHTWQKVVKFGFSAVTAAGGIGYAASTDFAVEGIGVAASGLLIGALLLNKKDRFPGMNALKAASAVVTVGLAVIVVLNPESPELYWLVVATAGVLGVLLTLSIGGADMPVVIALLNSYSGLAAAATGFVIDNNVLIIAGSLVGASGLILTKIMCVAMNRSLAHVLFGVMGPTGDTPDAEEVYKTVKRTSADELAMLLEDARKVVIIPGYGMAVAQAQHAVRDLANLLTERWGIEVSYGIHPVAGRMPGHMNVLLAEADVPYDQLVEMDVINNEMQQTDVTIVVGANDVVNPVARTDPSSPIAGMPIINADKSRTCVVIKRSLSPGFAGIPNPLFAASNTLMYFGDAKKNMIELIAAVRAS
jgi:NAD(P) transhydrogenase subunit beta